MESTSKEDLIEVFISTSAFSVVVCFLEGVETNLRDLKNGVPLKNDKLISIQECFES